MMEPGASNHHREKNTARATNHESTKLESRDGHIPDSSRSSRLARSTGMLQTRYDRSYSNQPRWLTSGAPRIIMSTCALQSCILFLCFLLGTMQPRIATAVKVVVADGGIQRAARRSGLTRSLRLRELQALNLSGGLSQDETVLLSWKSSSSYLNDNWVQNETQSGPCGWPGVQCGDWRGENRVTVVNLSSVNLTGPVPARISSLSALTSLSFASNELTGTIPAEISNCSNLQVLNFTNNMLTGNIPIELGRLVQLQSLDLSRNRLNGTIPSAIFANCANLVSFNLSSNNLNGSIPGDIGLCKNLRTVDVGNNSLKGEIPFQLGELLSLEELIMADNSGLNGSIPDTFLSNCQNLKKLDIAWNAFSGRLPPKLGNCSNLELMIMQGNFFTGSIPGDYGRLKKLKVMALGNNNLTEALPQEISNCSSLELLDAGNNRLSGPIPAWLGQLLNLQFLTLQINRFFGTIPVEVAALPMLRYLDLSFNFIEGRVLPEFGRVASLKLLRLSSNNMTGNIPAELGNITKLQGLDLSSNWLNGSIPSSLGNLQDLLWLQLGNNTLTGSIPEELTNCSSLMWLNLAKNELLGPIPKDFAIIGRESERVFRQNRENPWIIDGVGECSLLSTWSPGQSQHFETLLDISDPQKCHSWLPLLVQGALKLRSNRLHGEDKVLSYWQIGKNNFSGPLPDFTRATTLGFLILSENAFVGPIPEELGNLPLYNLNVSYNHLNGSIPNTLGNASLLVTLDMSFNDLSGALPHELGDLNALTVLNVSYNVMLRGTIPSKGQFTTLGWDPYLGDINLCFNDTDPIYKNALDHANWTKWTTNLPLMCSQLSSEIVVSGVEKKKHNKHKKIMKALTITFLSSLSTLVALLLVCTGYCMVLNWRKRVAEAKKELGFYWDETSGAGHWSEKSSLHIAVESFGMPCLESLTYAHLLHATNNFSSSNIVGDGGFGIVYKARLASGVTVAIKKLVQNGAQGPREFQAEMETLGMIQHENLVSLLGYCRNNEEMLLVYEYFMNGSLDDWLYESEEKAAQLGWSRRLRIALETARGLAFLHHECVHLIIHRDMKSSNILLNETFKAVLTDFGMARIMDIGCTHVSTVVAGTPGYVPPEYSQTWRATTRGDVYSFGVVLLELLSGKRPTGPHFNGRCGSNLVEMTRILVDSGRSDDLLDCNVLKFGAAQQIAQFLTLAIRCTESAPASRPSMIEVVQSLESIAGLPAFQPPLIECDADQ